MSELNAFIDKYILELEQIRDEVKAIKGHAVEVLAKELEIKKTYEAYFGYIFPEAVIRFKKDKPNFDEETRAEAKALLGWEE